MKSTTLTHQTAILDQLRKKSEITVSIRFLPDVQALGDRVKYQIKQNQILITK